MPVLTQVQFLPFPPFQMHYDFLFLFIPSVLLKIGYLIKDPPLLVFAYSLCGD